MSRDKDRRTPLTQLVVTADGLRVFDPEMVRDRKDLVETTVRNDLRYDADRPDLGLVGTSTLLGGFGLSLTSPPRGPGRTASSTRSGSSPGSSGPPSRRSRPTRPTRTPRTSRW
jgi:hypothetical protein